LIVLFATGQGLAVSSSLVPAASGTDRSGITAKQVTSIYYAYHPLGKADPFQPFVEKELNRKKLRTNHKAKPLSIFPLQRAGVGEFKLIGIAGNEQDRTAMVSDASGKFFPLAVGTVIGRNGGRVAQILEDRVIVEENATSGKGQYKTRRVPLKLQKVD